jgi:hypothetical protein
VGHQFEFALSFDQQGRHRSRDDPDVVPIRDCEIDLTGDFSCSADQGGVVYIEVELESATDEDRNRLWRRHNYVERDMVIMGDSHGNG